MAAIQQNLLAHIQDNQAHPSILQNSCHSISIGPVSASFCLNLDPPSASVELTILGHQIASCILSAEHQQCQIGGSISGFKAELDLTLDIPNLKLNYTITVCAPIVGCITKSGSIGF